MTRVLTLFSSFHPSIISKGPQLVGNLRIDKNSPWILFDGARQGSEHAYVMGFVIYLIDFHYFSVKENLRVVTNNANEFNALWYLLKLALDKGI